MGHKVHPKAFRLSTIQSWDSAWFSKQSFAPLLREDVEIRDFLRKELHSALVDRIEIERTRQQIHLIIHSAKPGFIIGRAGAGVEEIKKKIMSRFFRGRRVGINVSVKEVQHPSLSSSIVGQQIVGDLERRLPFRRVMKQAIERVMKAHAEGIKITIGGRLNGAEIARTETLAHGKVPLHNLRADIDFATVPAHTIYGTIGVKVWINRGEVFEKKERTTDLNSSRA
ncbi:MAG: 30S ribosomal protein S3 [Candidatus Uhrbacteria bacterium GW2011_GWF2_41_16]|jgi:small subunit ribosomal protein S3|uniref:Small ribosomal subunit protein uS3 n=2 Tax=Candidatus Uhriibacteriota TaxID=1752732 RepID=A0A0G0VC57_9BACT|nr:MAG: 30S ribosomal protein S3 [Candidatus Uhrbacteria bacterium GW2011_GWA2_41_10]KKR87524.1 MAG: 30S ribosomal protein S3 [Candidatus Uhrbacteria bacterium GW2011_GWC2_41_11]KKR98504.1 MAG: 30S ribosomal protein S3 [Candidatus Uhrbacteria bacterium GW2011_GWF2_41_16]HBO99960.1 30S ribosomal protein S3 [Candidatus Uhrbacteria bacterium]